MGRARRRESVDWGKCGRSLSRFSRRCRFHGGRLGKSWRTFQFHACGRLGYLRKSSALVDAYLKSMEKWTPKPCLMPLSTFFPELDDALVMEISLGGRCWCVASSPCGRYIAGWRLGRILWLRKAAVVKYCSACGVTVMA